MKKMPKIDLEIDVCIIGGSIAGNYLACLLSEIDVNCIVIEEHGELGKPFQCAGIISQKLLNLVEFPEEIILNRVQIAEIVAPNLVSISMSGKESPVVIDRVKFDTYFGSKAQQNGVKYYLKEKYLSHWTISNNKVLIQTTKRSICAKIIVGADGPTSKVAARFGIKHIIVPATQARFNYKHNPNKTSMYFNSVWKELFGYVVPEGDNGVCRIGLASKLHPNRAFMKFLRILKLDPSSYIDRQGGILPFGYPRYMAFQNTVLLGDAACMVKATTGGGIVMLISAAQILAPTIKKALANKDYSKDFFKNHYEKPIRSSLGRELKLHFIIRLVLLRLEPHEYNHFFQIYQSTNIHSIIENFADMDFPILLIKKLLWEKSFISYIIYLIPRYFSLIPKILQVLIG
jgi:digeranylgeranylglycerophospholipid reductase